MPRRRCVCPCHWAIGTTDRQRADGVDVADALEAITACARCQNAHSEALLYTGWPTEEAELPSPPEPASGCYEPPKDYDPTKDTD